MAEIYARDDQWPRCIPEMNARDSPGFIVGGENTAPTQATAAAAAAAEDRANAENRERQARKIAELLR